jgi:glucose-1-phosphate adenylyltransferase
MNTDEELRITEFEEKPDAPKNNLASMGIYIFSWKVLKEYLEKDDANPVSSHDFGKDVIPLLLKENKKLLAYPFKGYWKDVGTVKSLWEANMDLLNEDCELNLFDNTWRIYSVNPNQPPQYIAPGADVQDSLINEGCTIEGEIESSVLFQGVKVEKGAVIRQSVIMPDAIIGKNVFIEKAIIPAEIRIPDGAIICGDAEKDEILLVTEELVEQLIYK